MDKLRLAVRAFLSGVMISIGGSVYIGLMETQKVAGAILFAVGLVTICTFGFALFTGMAGYLFDGKIGKNAVDLAIVWFGNFLGCLAVGLMLRAVCAGSAFLETAETLAAAKLAIPLVKALVTGLMCGILMYVAVDNYRNHPHPLGKYLGIMLCVPAFILAGFEHSIADMYYLAVGLGFGIFSGSALAFVVCVTLGNLVGAVVFATLRKFGAGAATCK